MNGKKHIYIGVLFSSERNPLMQNVEWHEVIPETVGQYTGLTDKNGKKIFEGDICRFREWSKGDMCWIGKVHYEHQQFVISGDRNKECEGTFTLVMSRFIPENIEIIGNIHDNPELLGGNYCG
jgi:uncharacterized phage protein (TIGR01671 family)